MNDSAISAASGIAAQPKGIVPTKGRSSAAEFGDPRAGTSYALCLYDRSGPGGTPALKMSTIAPPGRSCRTRPCWKARTSHATTVGYAFADASRAIRGMNKITLQAGIAGRASITVKAGGSALDTPAPPFTGTVTVQLRSSDGLCWEADYGSPTVNQPGLFRASGD